MNPHFLHDRDPRPLKTVPSDGPIGQISLAPPRPKFPSFQVSGATVTRVGLRLKLATAGVPRLRF